MTSIKKHCYSAKEMNIVVVVQNELFTLVTTMLLMLDMLSKDAAIYPDNIEYSRSLTNR